MRYVLHRLPYTKRGMEVIGSVDPLIVGRPALDSSRNDDTIASAPSA